MFGDVLRQPEDVAQDIDRLNTICKEWSNFKKCLGACIKQCNIKEIVPCDCLDEHNIQKFNCTKCKGTGLIVVLNNEEDNNGNKN